MTFAGIILCGGQSTRMGRSKAWLSFGNESMLYRVVRLLREAVSGIVVVAAPDQDLPSLPADVVVVRDEVKGRGPLQGLAAGLKALSGQAEAAYVSACDVPFLQPAFVARMCRMLGEQSICVPRVGGLHHPLAAVYRVTVLPAIMQLLALNRLRPFFLFQEVPTRVVEAHELQDVDPGFMTLRNLNTPEEYREALELAGFRP
jgi:molybdopterin-guanine dinucleotide biosynthesis protein A